MIKVIARARFGYAEVVRHSGADACRFGGEDYTDNSRTSVVCPAHRDEYRRMAAKQRSKQRIRTITSTRSNCKFRKENEV